MSARIPSSRLLLSGLALALLSACGGGGGGGDDGGNNGGEAPRIAITAANAPGVAAQAIDASSAGFIGDSLAVTGVQVDVTSRPAALTSALRTAIAKLRTAKPTAALVGVAFSETLDCTGGGSVTISGEVADLENFSVGDALTLSFAGCREDGSRIDGALAMTLTEVNADASLFAATATARALAATSFGVTERANGSLRLRVDETSATVSRLSIESTRFDVDRLVSGTVRSTRSLIDYDYLGVTTISTGSLAETVSFVASGDFRVIGTVSFSVATTQAVVTDAGDEHPSAGSAVVTGAGGTSVKITVVDGGVRLDVDLDGNGSTDRTLQRSWAELDAEL
jgi:hypothetical protein